MLQTILTVSNDMKQHASETSPTRKFVQVDYRTTLSATEKISDRAISTTKTDDQRHLRHGDRPCSQKIRSQRILLGAPFPIGILVKVGKGDDSGVEGIHEEVQARQARSDFTEEQLLYTGDSIEYAGHVRRRTELM